MKKALLEELAEVSLIPHPTSSSKNIQSRRGKEASNIGSWGDDTNRLPNSPLKQDIKQVRATAIQHPSQQFGVLARNTDSSPAPEDMDLQPAAMAGAETLQQTLNLMGQLLQQQQQQTARQIALEEKLVQQ